MSGADIENHQDAAQRFEDDNNDRKGPLAERDLNQLSKNRDRAHSVYLAGGNKRTRDQRKTQSMYVGEQFSDPAVRPMPKRQAFTNADIAEARKQALALKKQQEQLQQAERELKNTAAMLKKQQQQIAEELKVLQEAKHVTKSSIRQQVQNEQVDTNDQSGQVDAATSVEIANEMQKQAEAKAKAAAAQKKEAELKKEGDRLAELYFPRELKRAKEKEKEQKVVDQIQAKLLQKAEDLKADDTADTTQQFRDTILQLCKTECSEKAEQHDYDYTKLYGRVAKTIDATEVQAVDTTRVQAILLHEYRTHVRTKQQAKVEDQQQPAPVAFQDAIFYEEIMAEYATRMKARGNSIFTRFNNKAAEENWNLDAVIGYALSKPGRCRTRDIILKTIAKYNHDAAENARDLFQGCRDNRGSYSTADIEGIKGCYHHARAQAQHNAVARKFCV